MNPTTKNILESKTFWVNALTLIATLSGLLPAKWSALILPLVNVGLRLASSQAVNLLSK